MASESFLSDPSKKRGRSNKTTSIIRKKKKSTNGTVSSRRDEHQDDISSDDNDEENSVPSDSEGENLSDIRDGDISSDEEFAGESEADKRRRLAKQYLENLKNEEAGGEYNDFDAQDMDDDIVGRRLQVDVAESKGYVYKFIGEKISSQIDDDRIQLITTRIGCKNLTGLHIRYPHLYTVSKDIELIKWNIAKGNKPKRVKHTRGGGKYFNLKADQKMNHHYDHINCVAASPDGKYVVTGGNDGRLIIWSSENLSCLKVLETRSAINAISFRRNSDQLYAACADLRVRTYSINQFAQLEVLYGHQDHIADISSLAKETCVSVGSRDKTAMFWKISEESRLTFRGGDSSEKPRRKKDEDTNSDPFFYEGSIDVVSMIDESHFITGSDNGNISLWSLAKKKAQFIERAAHGVPEKLPSSSASAETSPDKSELQIPQPQPYWITALHAVPFSDIFISGSYNGSLKVWRIDEKDLRSFNFVGEITNINGCVVKIDSVEIKEEKVLRIYALISKEHKFGRWLGKLQGGRNCLVSFSFDM